MKRYIFIVLALGLAISSWAKELPKQGFGIQIGWAQPILRLNSPDNVGSKDSLSMHTKLNGFKAGVVYDASMVKGFGSSVGINYTFGAASTPWSKKNTSFSERTQTLYQQVEVFVDWQYKFEVASETYLMLYTGPTIQCGLMWNRSVFERNEMTDVVTTTKTSRYATSNADELLTRLNVTWGVGAGFQYKRYFVRGGYDFGLVNPYKNRDFTNGNHTHGRLDQWNVKIGMYLWYAD